MIGRLRRSISGGSASALRDLLFNLISRDLKLKYQGSVLGFLWSLVNPLMTLVIYSWVFLVLMKSGIPHFPIFLMAGILPWNFFANATMSSVDAFTGNSGLIKKVPVPKTIFIGSVIGFNLVIFLMVLVIVLIAMPVFGVPYTFRLFLIIPGVLAEMALLVGLSLTVSTLNVLFHDTSHILEIMLMAWFWITPVTYEMASVPDKFRIILELNPMTFIINIFQSAVLGSSLSGGFYIGLGEILLLIFLGAWLYRRYRYEMVEWI